MIEAGEVRVVMTRQEYMHKQGKHAGETHAREGMPWMAADALTEWAEAHRRHACRACGNDDACAEWGNHRACPAGLRRTFRRAYRTAYRETMRARIAAQAMSAATTSETAHREGVQQCQ